MVVDMTHARILLISICLGFLGGFGLVSISMGPSQPAVLAIVAVD